MERPQTKKRNPELLYIVGCEGVNQEKKYFEKVQEIINSIPSRKFDIRFDITEPFGGTPRSIVERTINKSIGKTNKVAVFDYDGKKHNYEEALDLAKANHIEVGNTSYCFDLWLLLHKKDYFNTVSHQDDYADDIRTTFKLREKADIKKAINVDRILAQININDIFSAMKRAETISLLYPNKRPHITPSQKVAYYDNPDTQMHTVLKSIFKKVGIKW